MVPVILPAGDRGTGRSRARRMAPEDRREQLLDVATRLVGEQGFHQVSVEAVARAAGVTRTTIYKHFDDLDDLFLAVVDRAASRALSQVEETALTELTQGDPVELLLESLAAYLSAVQSHPLTWRLILMPPEGAPEELHQRIALGRAGVLTQLVSAVDPAMALVGRSADAELTARVLSAVADEYARLILTDPERFGVDRAIAHARWILGHARLTPPPSDVASG